MRKIIWVLVILFLVELLVLFQVADSIGGFNTLILMLIAMFIGFALVKVRFRSIMNNLSQGKFEVKSIFLPLAGFLFLFPGFISDIMALLLLIPSVQHQGENLYTKRFSGSDNVFFHQYKSEENSSYHRGQTIDVKPRHDDDKD